MSSKPSELGPVPSGRSLRELPDLLASLPHLSEEEAADFERDIEAARAELGQFPVDRGD
jgi:hypothetical protein